MIRVIERMPFNLSQLSKKKEKRDELLNNSDVDADILSTNEFIGAAKTYTPKNT